MGCICNCASSVVRTLLFIFNFVFVVCGIVLLSLGVVFKLKIDTITDFVKQYDINVAPVLFIVVGCIVFIIAFFGCCGALKNNSCMLNTYAVILLILLVVEIVGAYYALKYVDDNDIKKSTEDELWKQFRLYGTDEDATKAIDSVQIQLECCGIKGYEDYQKENIYPNGTLPISCCGYEPEDHKICSAKDPSEHYYERGCLSDIQDLIDYVSTVLGGVAIGIACVLVFGIVFGFCLGCQS